MFFLKLCKRFLLWGIAIGVLSSCALLLNDSHKIVHLHTNEGVFVTHNEDSVLTTGEPLQLQMEREKMTQKIVLTTDSSEKEICIEPRLSAMYWLNIFNYGPGYLIDLITPRRFTYPPHIFTEANDTTTAYYNYQPVIPAGSWQLQLSIPEVNYFYLQPDQISAPIAESVGFAGVCMGLNYFYRENYFVHTSVTAAADFFLPVPVPVNGWGWRESASSVSVKLAHGFRNYRFSHSHGITFSRNFYYGGYYEDVSSQSGSGDRRAVYEAIGFHLDLYLQMNHSLHLGLIYRPSVWRPSMEKPWAYEHLMSLELMWRVPLKIRP